MSEYVLLPARLTAENGAKGLLLGEFKEGFNCTCPECGGESDDECLTCENMGEVWREVPVSWDNIKAIYAMVVEHLAVPGEPKMSEHELRYTKLKWAILALAAVMVWVLW